MQTCRRLTEMMEKRINGRKYSLDFWQTVVIIIICRLNIAQWRCVCKGWIQSGAELKKGMGYPKAPHLTNTVCV